MDKIKFQKFFNGVDISKFENIYDKFNLVVKTGKTIILGEFLTPDLYSGLVEASQQEKITVNTWEFYEECERKLCVLSGEKAISVELPVCVLQIVNKSKFSILSHREYLGSLMSLDIKREKFGDLVVKNNCAYVPVMKELSQYIIDNLQRISNSPCEVKVLDIYDKNIPKPEFDTMNIIVTSMRIDCFLPSVVNRSRSSMADYLCKGKVLVNYMCENRKERLLEIGDIITVRGVGKYRIMEILGKTQKDRIKLLIHKFV